VVNVRVYQWDLPEDTEPLKDNIRAICRGDRDCLLLTSAHQAVNLLRMAKDLGCESELRKAIDHLVVASIGPTTSEMLQHLQLPVDIESTPNKMGHLVQAAAEKCHRILKAKRFANPYARPQIGLAPDEVVIPSKLDRLGTALAGSPFLQACFRQPTSVTPIWLMRQAGRYMSEYRAVRDKVSFLELVKNPSLCAEVMVTAVDKLGVDAAIIFSDLLPILEPLGLKLEFAAGDGPVIHNPLREAKDVDRLRELDSLEPLDFVMQTVTLTRAAISPKIPVIGFAGAPFTLASYAIEGGGSRNYLRTKSLMYRDEGAWDAIMGRLSRAVAKYLTAQVAAGAQAVQLFDSWVGCLGVEDYRRYVLPYTKAIIASLPRGVPVINFATGNPALLPLLAEAGGDIIGIDWRIELDAAWNLVGDDKGVQGNLEPAVLLTDRETIRRRAKDVLQRAGGRWGHIFNVGHGIVPQTPVENVQYLVEVVRELSEKRERTS
jgi:uroporphyrinogen decarboxylase